MRLLPRTLLVAFALASIATSTAEQEDLRLPCDGAESWASPLVLRWEGFPRLPADAPAFRDALRLEDEAGNEVPWELVLADPSTVVVCPTEGLAGSTWFVWHVGPFNETPSNATTIPPFRQTGSWSFRTAPAGVLPVTAATCASFFLDNLTPCGDTGDTDERDTG